MRWTGAALLCLLAACAGSDETPVWEPAAATVTTTTAVPSRAGKTFSAPPANTKSRILYDEAPPPEPRVQSKEPLPAPQRRALESERQALNAEIRALERRAHFDVDRNADRRHPRANDERRLRSLKARQRSVLRRLRGE